MYEQLKTYYSCAYSPPTLLSILIFSDPLDISLLPIAIPSSVNDYRGHDSNLKEEGYRRELIVVVDS